MKMIAIALAACVSFPLPAGAQVRVGGAPPPMPSAPPGGIHVSTRATIRLAAKNVRFIAQVRGDADEAAALDAMRAAGISDPIIGPAGNQISNGQTLVRGIIHDVSRAKLDRIGLAVAAFIATHQGISINNVSFSPAAADCTAAAEQGAREAAFDGARRKGAAIAAAAGATLGPIESISETGGCPIDDDTAGLGSTSLDLGTMTFAVTMFETVTFGIGPGDGAMRRTL